MNGRRLILRAALLPWALLALLLALPGFLPQRSTSQVSSRSDDRTFASGRAPWVPYDTTPLLEEPFSGRRITSAATAPAPGSWLRGEVPDDDDDPGEGAESHSKKLLRHPLVDVAPAVLDDSPASLRRLVAFSIRAPPLV